MIRAATPNDLNALLELGCAMHAESAYHYLPFDQEKVRALLLSCMKGFGCVFVAERDGEIIGGFFGIITEHYFCDVKMACDLALFVRPDRRGALAAVQLIEAYIDFALKQGVDPRNIQIGISTGVDIDRTAKLYERMGFERTGGIFKYKGA